MIASGRDKIETDEQVIFLLFYIQIGTIKFHTLSLIFICSMQTTFHLELNLYINYCVFSQFKQAAETAKKLDLDGIVVIGGDDSNTNACLLAENFR